MKKTTERFNRWKEKKESMGFKHIQLFIPLPLVTEIKQFISQWKTDHMDYYEKK
jgi:hypothetical protein